MFEKYKTFLLSQSYDIIHKYENFGKNDKN